MHVTPSARLVVVSLLGVAGVVALARTRPPASSAPRAPFAVAQAPAPAVVLTGEGDALRDGRCVDVNRASATELALLPGVGPRLAAALIEARAAKGPFRAASALRAVRGVGPKTLAKLAPMLCF